MKIIFMGTPEFAIPTLDKLIIHHDVICVFTQPPRRSGRGMNLQKSPVHLHAEKLKLKIHCPNNLNEKGVQSKLIEYEPDIIIVIAYGIILPKYILNIPKFGAINGHASLLPKWRGAAPIQRSIEAGDKTTGCSIMLMDTGLDTGPILLQKQINILSNDDSISIHNKLSRITSKCLLETTKNIILGKIKLKKQDSSRASYARKLTKEEAKISWQLSSTEIYNKMKAFRPFPGVFTKYKLEKYKIIKGKPFNKKHNLKPGTILSTKKDFLIACGKNTIFKIELIQKSGKKILDSNEFLLGSKMKTGDQFE